MAVLEIRNLEIGTGIPKICVPIVEKTQCEVLKVAEKIATTTADLVEWRVDWFEEIFDFDKIQEVLASLRGILGDRPILFTCRTSKEGGEISLTQRQYETLNQSAIESGKIDLVDVEMFSYPEAVEELVAFAHEHKIKIVGSNHDFQKTPAKDEIVCRLCTMQKSGVDLVKIAVMPQNRKDVLTLLAATEEMSREHGETPVVTMSMGKKGVVSRIAGEVFGSAITFGTVGKSSAPGQLEIEELRRAMNILR